MTFKRYTLPLATLLSWAAISTTSAQNEPRDWENPAVLGINKLPYHATLQLPSKEAECKEIISLDGQWRFQWSRNPDERPADFYKEDYDVSGTSSPFQATGKRKVTAHLSISTSTIRLQGIAPA